jgi:Tol biopolymer transport system component
MGEVYRARDTDLHREIAIKILPDAVSGDATAEARFEREARAIASLNHPNICAMHDAGVDAGRRFLVMELLEGETLQQRLARGPFDLSQLVEHAIMLADALHAAHARDIIHRDLKPGNILLTSRGHLKILDFGLARATDSSDAVTRGTKDVITGKGIAVGTTAYMSPEQIRGQPLDARTDVFSLGLVLYEMAAGQPAFAGSTGVAVAASILNDEVTPPADVRPDLSAEINGIILKSLEKDPDLRYQSAADLRADLRRLKRQLSTQATPPSDRAPALAVPLPDASGGRPTVVLTHPSASSDTQLLAAIVRRHRFSAAAVAAVIVLAIAAAVSWWPQRGESNAAAIALSNLQVQPLTLDGTAILGTISPDGRFLVYERSEGEVNRGIRVRQIPGDSDIPLVPPGRFTRISSLTVTPDGSFVDIVAVTGAAAVPDAWRIPLLGGTLRPLLSHVVSAIGWSPDGRRMAFVRSESETSEMTVVTTDADGSNPHTLTTRRAPNLFFCDLTANAGRPPSRPAWSPDGDLLAVTGYSSGALDRSEIVVLDATTGTERPSIPVKGSWSEVVWLDDTRLLLVGHERPPAASGLWIIDSATRNLTRVTREFGFFMNLSVTADRMAAVAKRFTRSSGIWLSDASGRQAEMIVPLSVAGAALPTLDAAGDLTYTAFTVDGSTSIYHVPRGTPTPFQIVETTVPPMGGRFYDVSSDGRTMVYTEVGAPYSLWRVQHDGSDRVRLVERDVGMPRLTPDGQTVLFTKSNAPGLYSILAAGGKERQLTNSIIVNNPNSGRRAGFSVSADGKRVLLATGTPGLVAVCDLPDCTNLRQLRLPSADWAPDAAGVAYVRNGTTIMEQPLDGGSPRVLAQLDGNEPIINFRWSPDGSRLVTSRGAYPNDMVMIKGLRPTRPESR